MSFREDMHTPTGQQEPTLTIDEAISAVSHAQVERDQTSYGYEVAVALLYSRTVAKNEANKAYQKALTALYSTMKGA